MIDISMSAIKEWQRCQRQYFYRWVQGLIPRSLGANVDMGTLFHEGMAGGYRALQKNEPFLIAAHEAVKQVLAYGYDHHEEHFTVNLSSEEVNLVNDMLDFYWQNVGSKDHYDEILTVEESAYVEVAGFQIRCTFDATIKEGERIVIQDHKTVGNVNEAMEFLSMDFQILMYLLCAYKKYGHPVEFDYNMVRREVPPGFGHRSLLTKSGAKSKASTEVTDYVRRERIYKSEKELLAFEAEVERMLNAIRAAKEHGYYGRTIVKTGGQKCSSCPYFGVCATELLGRTADRATLGLLYRFEVKDTLEGGTNV